MKIVVVNEKDEVIGVKERSLMDYSSDIYRSSGLWLTNSKGQVLLSKRSNRKDKDPGLWAHSVGGTVDEGETYRDNIYKEAQKKLDFAELHLPKAQRYFMRSHGATSVSGTMPGLIGVLISLLGRLKKSMS
jgi:isopentenyldiphosphate isomerase